MPISGKEAIIHEVFENVTFGFTPIKGGSWILHRGAKMRICQIFQKSKIIREHFGPSGGEFPLIRQSPNNLYNCLSHLNGQFTFSAD